jgi:hypothetical protein
MKKSSISISIIEIRKFFVNMIYLIALVGLFIEATSGSSLSVKNHMHGKNSYQPSYYNSEKQFSIKNESENLIHCNCSKKPKILLLFKQLKCYKLKFVQINSFLKRKEVYTGTLKYSVKGIQIIYNTQPPFIIRTEGNYILLGYKGQTPRVFKKDKIPNPLLSLLLNLDRLDIFFKVIYCKSNYCLLKPKGFLKRRIKEVDVLLNNNFVKELVLRGRGKRNIVRIKIENFTTICH